MRTMRPILQAGHGLSSCSSTLARLSRTVGFVGGTAPSNAERQFLSARTIGQKAELPDAHKAAAAGNAG
jgi:hypothetical protein